MERLNVLYIATRAPYGRMHGHKMAMRTFIRSLQALGHEVVVAAFAVPGDIVMDEDLDAVTHYLRLPSKARIVRNIVTKGLFGPLSLNECLYASDEAARTISQIVHNSTIDFVVADMIRTASYGERTKLPWMLDVDDLLSERYAMYADGGSRNEALLGHLEETIPAWLRPTARWTFRTLLRHESRVVAKRELYWVNRAFASSLRSMRETELLRQRASGCRVFCMPVSVPIPKTQAHSLNARPMAAVFTGGLNYQPNVDALRVYIDQIIPAFERCGITAPVLNVIGAAPDAARIKVHHPSIKFLGYVPDVNEAIQNAQVFFAPIVSGSGIKTKVLEALACGVPLVSLPMGLTGLHGEHDRHYLRANDADDFVRQYARLKDDVGLARSLGDAGRKLAIDFYSLEAAIRHLAPELSTVRSATRAA